VAGGHPLLPLLPQNQNLQHNIAIMHAAFNTEVFRRNPKLGIGLGLILLGIAVCGFYVEYQEYRSLGSAPQSMTLAEANPSMSTTPDGARWVQLTESLVPDCEHALQETSNGSVTSTRILASDAAKERWVYVRLTGNATCDAAAIPLQGILRKAAPGLPAWLQDHGVTPPASAYPLMEISAGDNPGSVLTLVHCFAGVGIFALVCIGAFLSLLKKSANPHQMDAVRMGTVAR
jgi:hypothetical protein